MHSGQPGHSDLVVCVEVFVEILIVAGLKRGYIVRLPLIFLLYLEKEFSFEKRPLPFAVPCMVAFIATPLLLLRSLIISTNIKAPVAAGA